MAARKEPLTLKQYVDGLRRFLGQHPECADMVVVTSRDDEGNGYNQVWYDPTAGYFDGNDFESVDADDDTGLGINAVCVN